MMDNISLFFWVQSSVGQNQILDGLMKIGAEPLIYILILQVLVLAITGKPNDKKSFLICFLVIPIAFLIIRIIHIFYFEPRPFISFNFSPLVKELNDASFPSRHTTISSAIAFSFIFFKSKWATLFLIVALWIAIARVYVGVHYPLDILGGFVVAVVSLFLSLKIKKVLVKLFI